MIECWSHLGNYGSQFPGIEKQAAGKGKVPALSLWDVNGPKLSLFTQEFYRVPGVPFLLVLFRLPPPLCLPAFLYTVSLGTSSRISELALQRDQAGP